jgi:TM2 domain-containing membrane protein YozV
MTPTSPTAWTMPTMPPPPVRRREIAVGLAFFLGGWGIHKFYLGMPGWGIVYALFCWTFIPAIAATCDVVNYLLLTETAFNRRFNPEWVRPASAFGDPFPTW